MNKIPIFESDKVEENLFRIEDELRLRHIFEVLHGQERDKVKLCLVNKGLGLGQFIKMDDHQIDVQVIDREAGLSPWINLVVGLSRPPTCKKIMEHGTSLGVGEFHFFTADLSEKSYATAKVFSPKKFHELLHLGLAQSGRYYKEPHVSLSPKIQFVEKQNFPNKFFLDLEGTHYFDDFDMTMDQNITLAIGPERGWTDIERQYLIEQGFQSVKITDSILRTEIATFTALGQLHLCRDRHRRKQSSSL